MMAIPETHEKPSKSLRTPQEGDQTKLVEVGRLVPGILPPGFWSAIEAAYWVGFDHGADKRRHQRRELRRLNQAIIGMHYLLHGRPENQATREKPNKRLVSPPAGDPTP